MSDNFKELIEEAKLLSADDYKSALTEQNNLANELSRFMKKNDIDLILNSVIGDNMMNAECAGE